MGDRDDVKAAGPRDKAEQAEPYLSSGDIEGAARAFDGMGVVNTLYHVLLFGITCLTFTGFNPWTARLAFIEAGDKDSKVKMAISILVAMIGQRGTGWTAKKEASVSDEGKALLEKAVKLINDHFQGLYTVVYKTKPAGDKEVGLSRLGAMFADVLVYNLISKEMSGPGGVCAFGLIESPQSIVFMDETTIILHLAYLKLFKKVVKDESELNIDALKTIWIADAYKDIRIKLCMDGHRGVWDDRWQAEAEKMGLDEYREEVDKFKQIWIVKRRSQKTVGGSTAITTVKKTPTRSASDDMIDEF